MTEESIGNELLAALEVAILEVAPGGMLRHVGSVPRWFARLRPDTVSGREMPRESLASPFLENFLIDADEFWAARASGRLRSGPWTEVGPTGTEFHLEASAVCVGERRILLLESEGYEEKQATLQRARSDSLRRRERKRGEESGSR